MGQLSDDMDVGRSQQPVAWWGEEDTATSGGRHIGVSKGEEGRHHLVEPGRLSKHSGVAASRSSQLSHAAKMRGQREPRADHSTELLYLMHRPDVRYLLGRDLEDDLLVSSRREQPT